MGPRLFQVMPQLAYNTIAAMLAAYVVMVAIGIPLAKSLGKMSLISTKILVPTIISYTLVGAFVERRYIFDMWLALGFGFLGYIMKRTGYSPHALLLGVILGPMAEQYFLRAILLGNGNPMILFSRSFANVLWVLLLMSLFLPLVVNRLKKRTQTT
jgi:putative tricarboxylic transport membrane protein